MPFAFQEATEKVASCNRRQLVLALRAGQKTQCKLHVLIHPPNGQRAFNMKLTVVLNRKCRAVKSSATALFQEATEQALVPRFHGDGSSATISFDPDLLHDSEGKHLVRHAAQLSVQK